MTRESSTAIAGRALEALHWQKTLSRAKQTELQQLIADILDESIADVLAEFADFHTRIAESLAELRDDDSGRMKASADAYDRAGQQLRAGAEVWRANLTLRALAAAHPELRFAPENPSAHDAGVRVWLHTDTLTATLAALRAWTSHITDAELHLDRPEPPITPTLRLTGRLGSADICVLGELNTTQPSVTELFLPRFPATGDTMLPLDTLNEATATQHQS